MAKIFEDTGVGSERRKNHHELKISPRREIRQFDILVRSILLSFLTMLNDIAALEEDILQHLAPLRGTAEQELEIHPEMLRFSSRLKWRQSRSPPRAIPRIVTGSEPVRAQRHRGQRRQVRTPV